MKPNKACFMVRAEVASEADRVPFDHWYATHHLPLAMNMLRAQKCWRFWSRSDPSVHIAQYQFNDMATLQRRLDAPDFKLLVADFNAAWPHVSRSRDLLELMQEV
jgi:hypothetical protein